MGGTEPTSLLRTVFTCASDRKSTRLNSSHVEISYAVFCLKKKTTRKGSPRNLSWKSWLALLFSRKICCQERRGKQFPARQAKFSASPPEQLSARPPQAYPR